MEQSEIDYPDNNFSDEDEYMTARCSTFCFEESTSCI
jgi:hypothetical protein